MRLTPKQVDCSQGFTLENDLFNRERFAKQLENIIINSEDESLVFAIDDSWGSGKTTFLKMWEGRIKNNENPNLKMIYFDAFENDYQQDAFLAIASKIYDLIDKKNTSLKKKFINNAKVVGKNLFGIAAKVGVNVATAGLLNGSVIEGSTDTITEALNDPLDKFIEDRIKGAKKSEASLIDFKETLEKISLEKKIIFVIDELDRARPDFSLEILEKIKHVFSAQNFIFILSMNREQFEKTIIKKYGEINATLYLSKFITHWFNLPKETEAHVTKTVLATYCKYLFDVILNSNRNYEVSYDVITRLLQLNRTSLRETEKTFGFMALILASFKEKVSESKQASIAIASYITIFHPNEINNILEQKSTLQEILKLLNFQTIVDEYPDKYIARLLNTEFLPEKEYYRLATEGSDSVVLPQHRRPTFVKPILIHVAKMYVDNN